MVGSQKTKKEKGKKVKLLYKSKGRIIKTFQSFMGRGESQNSNKGHAENSNQDYTFCKAAYKFNRMKKN